MTASKARIKANNKYNKKAYWRPSIFFRKEDQDEIQKYAAQYDSFNAFIQEAVSEKIARMKLDEK
jgi:hypothetical protein